MNLIDGLRFYKDQSDSDWEFTLRVEASAREVLRLISLHSDNPTPSGLAAAHRLLMDIEKWKAMCLKERMGNAERNSPTDVWCAFHGAVAAVSDVDALLSIMQLKGFGSSIDEETGQRRAKVATAALRFLMPDSWGVVDWRTSAILGFLDKTGWDVGEALRLAKNEKANFLRSLYDIIDEDGACAVNQRYRERKSPPEFSRTVDVEMGLFGLSIMAWPFPKSAATAER
jgi:hypothetical protein